MAATAPQSRTEVVNRTLAIIHERLPASWKITPQDPLSQGPGNVSDAVFQVSGPDNTRTRFILQATNLLDRRDVPQVVTRLKALTTASDVPVLAGRYLSRSVRDSLEQNGISYIDVTGNIRITASVPAIFLAQSGADSDPWRGSGRPLSGLKGEPAAKLVRALLDNNRQWRIRELIAESAVSTGTTYRVLDYLEREDLIAKEDGNIRVRDWEQLLRTWSKESSSFESRRVARYFEPRGMDAFKKRMLENRNVESAITGSAAANEWAPIAPTRAAYVYVSSIELAVQAWGLRAEDATPNVILLEAEPNSDVVFKNSRMSEAGLTLAAPAQIAADLLNGPGREPSQGEGLISWMKENEGSWRYDK